MPWFAVPVGSFILARDGVTWHTLIGRTGAAQVVTTAGAFTVDPSATVRVAVPDLVDILSTFARVGLPAVPLAIDVPAAQLDVITKRQEIQWLSQRLTR